MKKTRRHIATLLVVWTAIFGAAQQACAAVSDPKLLQEIKTFFADGTIRAVGSPGNQIIEEKVYQKFAASGLEHGAIKFQAPAFLPGETRLTVAPLATIRLRVLHPTMFRPGNFKERDFTTKLVYLGRGSEEDLAAAKGLELDGSIVVMDFKCGDAWQRLLRFGVRGFIFYGYEDCSYYDARTKVYATEVSVPRFAIDRQDADKLLAIMSGAGNSVAARLQAEPSRWRNVMLRNPWVFIPGVNPDLKNEVFVFTAPLDVNGIIPELARGAQSGANLFLLMRLLDQFVAHPPERSVLLVAVNARTARFHGDRRLAWHLLAVPEDVTKIRKALIESVRVQDMFVQSYGSLDLDDPGRDQENEDFLIGLRTRIERPAGVDLTVKDPVVTLAKRDVNNVKSRKLILHQNEGIAADERARLAEQLEGQYKSYVNVLTLFNRVGVKTVLSDLDGDERAILKGYVAQVVDQNTKMRDLNRRELELEYLNDHVREALQGKTVSLVIPLELTWGNSTVGFCSFTGTWIRSKRWAHRLGVNTTHIAGEVTDRLGWSANPFIDTMTNKGGLLETHFFPGVKSSIVYYHGTADTAAVAMRNAYADSGRAFTPGDTFARLDRDALGRLMAFVPALFSEMLSDRHITSAAEMPLAGLKTTLAVTQLLKTYKFDELAATVSPELPVPGSVVLAYPQIVAGKVVEPLIEGDVINSYVCLTDVRATALMVSMSTTGTNNAFHFDDDFLTVDHAVDIGEAGDKRALITAEPVTVLTLFGCQEFQVYERRDSSFISFRPITVHKYMPLVGQRNSEPRRYGMTGIAGTTSKAVLPMLEGPAAVFMKPSENLKLLTTISVAADKRFVLAASADDPEGRGFSSPEAMGADFFAQAAADMSRLNHYRVGKMRGVTNELADGFLREGDQALAAVQAARDSRDHLGYVRSVYRALGGQVKAYHQIASTTNDMLKAVVFYMALLLPFCFFVGKLLFKFVKIEAQMAVFAVLFGLTFIVFRTIHPAFRIAQAPGAILIAFIMGVLACFVIHILHSRFEGEMQLLFRSFTGMDTTAVGYSTVGQKAMIIGVNNMKRRRIRTALTTGTIVLVTFTMLSFSSISKKVSPTIIPISKESNYTGVFYSWIGSQRMDEATLQVFRDIFVGRGDLVVRRWLLPANVAAGEGIIGGSPFPIAADNGLMAVIDGVLGLSVAEDGFLTAMPLLPGGRFFSADDAPEAVLAQSMAKTLGIGPDHLGKAKVTMYGHDFTIIGIVDDEKLKAIRDINRKPILPIRPPKKQQLRMDEIAGARGGDSLLADPTASESGVFYVDPGSLLILPLETARQLGAEPFSISIRLPDDTPIWPVMNEILTITNAKFFMSSRQPFRTSADSEDMIAAGVYYVGSGYSTSIGGLSRLIIPLIIAGTIILNTMLGSVYERKYEIAVYNAIGLNPTHIGMFFLAEAFVYSVIGSVGGYLIGQVMAITLTRFHLVEGINLNFSSLGVVYVIMFTVAVVLLSTLYPARAAARAAVPSGKRTWALPEHDGNTMEVIFPFIYQDELALGVMGYLDEYFARYTEGSTGNLIAALLEKQKTQDDQGRQGYELVYDLALAPFDLGVTQTVTFRAAYDETVQSYRVVMTVTRLSGQDTTWVTTNKPFLEKMRSYLINWRNLDATRHAFYVQQAQRLFS